MSQRFALMLLVSPALLSLFLVSASARAELTSVPTLGIELIAELGKDRARAIAWSPDGSSLAAAGEEGVWIWSGVQPGTAPRRLAPEGANAVAFSADNATVLTAGEDGTVTLRRVADGEVVGTLSGHQGAVFCVATSADGSLIATGGADSTVRLWDTVTLEERRRLERHTDEVRSVVFSPDSRRLASAGFDTDHSAVLWDLSGDSEPLTLVDDDWVGHLAFSPDGSVLAIGGEDALYLVHPETGERDESLGIETSALGGLAYRRQGDLLAIGSHFRSDGATVELVDTATGEERARLLSGRGLSLSDVAFHPNGEMLAVASANFRVSIYRLHEIRAQTFSQQAEIQALAASPESDLLAVVGRSDFGLFTLADGELVGERISGGPSIGFEPAGRVLAASRGDDVHLWNVETGEEIGTPARHPAPVRAVTFDPRGRFLASSGDDEGVRLWHPEGGEELATIDSDLGVVRLLTVAPDGSFLLLGGAADVSVQPLDERGNPGLAATTLEAGSRLRDLAVSADGSRIAAVGTDGARLWHQRGRDRAGNRLWEKTATRLRGHAGEVYSILFSTDGSLLYSAGDDGSVRLWDAETGAERLSLFVPRKYGHIVRMRGLALSADGSRLVAGDSRGAVTVWRLEDLSW